MCAKQETGFNTPYLVISLPPLDKLSLRHGGSTAVMSYLYGDSEGGVEVKFCSQCPPVLLNMRTSTGDIYINPRGFLEIYTHNLYSQHYGLETPGMASPNSSILKMNELNPKYVR